MRVIYFKILKDFYTAYPDSEQLLKAWLNEAQKAEWKDPAEIKAQYIGSERLYQAIDLPS